MGYVYDDTRGTEKKVYAIFLRDVDGSPIRRREPGATKARAHGIIKAEERAVLEAKEQGFPTLEAYKQAQAKKLDDAKKAATTFETFSTDYLDFVKSRIKLGKIKDSTHERYSDLMRLYINPFFGKLALTDIDATLIESYRDRRLEKGGAAEGTVCQEISILSGLFTLALKRKKIPMHPVWGLVEKPALPKRTPRYLKSEEKTALLSKLSEPLKSAVIISMNTGFRESELASLTWADVDTEKQTITIPGDRRKRKVPLVVPYNETVAEVLKFLETLPTRFKSPYVITNPRMKEPTRYDRFNNSAWRKAVRDAGLKLRWHDLRSHYGSTLAQKGRSAPEIQALLGQSSLASTQKYINLFDSLRAAVQSVDGQNEATTTQIATQKPVAESEESKAAVNS